MWTCQLSKRLRHPSIEEGLHCLPHGIGGRSSMHRMCVHIYIYICIYIYIYRERARERERERKKEREKERVYITERQRERESMRITMKHAAA